MAEPGLYLKFRGLGRFNKAIETPGPNVKRALETWKNIYAAFVRTRFVLFSRGGGDWPPLKPATIAARRQGKKGGKGVVTAILRDTGLLFSHLAPQFMPITQFTHGGGRFQATVTMGGSAKYPDGSVTTTDVIGFHQTGAGHLPVRKILVPPDTKTKQTMGKVMTRAIGADSKAG